LLVSATDAVRPGRIRFEPALEGLRGFALLGMLCFHSQFTWAAGGFLPVSTFFTLSGYLITSLFLIEWERTGHIDLWSFWARRFRRLMPAALLTLGAMVLFGAFVATPDQRARLSDDVLWALLYVANWHFYLSDSAYANLFSAPSPVQHFWSLAIEEQYYFVFPLIVAAMLRLGAGSRVVLGGGLAALVLSSVMWSVWLRDAGGSIDRVYYGSDTRAAELLLGALLAVWMYGKDLSSRWGGIFLASLGTLALVVMVYLWSAVPLEAGWLYTGGFAGYALLSVAVIAAAVQPAGPVRTLLSIPIVRWSGRVSYGAYLFHWPVFLWLSAERTALDGAALFTLRTIVTFGLAGLSYELLESPIRNRRWLTGWLPYVVTPVAVVSVALATNVVAEAPRFEDGGYDPRADVAELPRFIERMRKAKPPPAEADPPSRHRLSPRIAFYGD
jgi:peptidoglycan/LPS O-acetylase OafA/YrhL